MKILQVTDTHVVEDGGHIYGIDPVARLAACVAHINAHHADARFCVLSGDLTNEGTPGAYGVLKGILDRLAVPYHIMIGNHDDRDALLAAFPKTPRDEAGFVQYALETPAGRLLILDTVEPGTHGGRFCDRRAAWLGARLAETGDDPVYIFMHHPPFPVGLPAMDRIGLDDPGPFAAAVTPHRGRVDIRHIFFGHVHRPVSGSWRGIAFSALPSTVHQVALDLEAVAPVPKTREPPAYGVILIEPERTLVHVCPFLDDSRIAGAQSPPPPGRSTPE
ncbi:MAG: phosphodiesterase [Kiloniellales bacterium]|nr:phosphodiesterase [Kiloniellales bacterium]